MIACLREAAPAKAGGSCPTKLNKRNKLDELNNPIAQ